MQLKHKSDAFDAFRTYKAFSENHFQTKMKKFQDDKGGEYMFEQAEFDERVFPGLAKYTHTTSPADLITPSVVPLPPVTTPNMLLDLGGDGDDDDLTTATLPPIPVPVPVPELPPAPLDKCSSTSLLHTACFTSSWRMVDCKTCSTTRS